MTKPLLKDSDDIMIFFIGYKIINTSSAHADRNIFFAEAVQNKLCGLRFYGLLSKNTCIQIKTALLSKSADSK